MNRPRKHTNLDSTAIGAEYTPEEVAFMVAMNTYQRRNAFRPLDCRDILLVAHALGYRKIDPGPDAAS